MTSLIHPKQSKLLTKVFALDPDHSRFTVIGKDRVIAKRPYNKDAMMEHVLIHILSGLAIEELPDELQWLYQRIPKTSWCNPGCSVRVFGGRICPDNVQEMKQRVARASIVYLKNGLYMLKEYGPHGELLAWKFYDDTLEADRVWATRQLEVAREKRERYLDKMEAIVYGSEEPEPPGAASAEAPL